MRKCIFIIIAILLFFPDCLFCKTEKRIALVIGNSDYYSKPLTNPVNDAKSMEGALKACHFDVTHRFNVNRQEMFEAIREFGDQIKRADVGLFYYAGHALQVNGENYLIPIGADVKKEHEVRFQCLEASLVTSNMEAASNPLNIIILDACRDNPFRSFRSTASGLAEMSAPVGTIIQYATSAGGVAIDYDELSGKNGLYTSKLLKYMQTPGLEINMMFRKVREEVYYASDKKQTPWESNSLMGGSFFFKPTSSNEQSFTNTLGMTFVRIHAGSFKMGSPTDEPGRDSDEIQHRVTLTQDYYMQTTEVTQGQWQAIMGNNPSYFKNCSDRCPVEKVSWNDVQAFIKKLNTMDSGRNYRLPTETEWEYAARAGTQAPFAFGYCLSTNYANYHGNYPLTGCSKGQYRKKTLPVGSLQKNAWGLYDMHGNVWEWCQDWYGAYSTGNVINPSGPSSGWNRVFRGGSWNDNASYCRSARRYRILPECRIDNLGFRLCAPGR